MLFEYILKPVIESQKQTAIKNAHILEKCRHL